jgi:hypothetical protein
MMRVEHGPAMLEGNIGNGILEGNPFHEDILDVLEAISWLPAADCSVTRATALTGVFAGDLAAGFLAGGRRAAAATIRSIDAPVDIVVTSGGGYPLDSTFYQSIKGMIGCLGVLRPGGTIVIASRVSEGTGSEEFRRLLSGMESPRAFMEKIFQPDFFSVDQWMVQHLCQVLRKARVIVVSEGLPPEALGELHVEGATSVEVAIAGALERHDRRVDRGDPGGALRAPDGPRRAALHRGRLRDRFRRLPPDVRPGPGNRSSGSEDPAGGLPIAFRMLRTIMLWPCGASDRCGVGAHPPPPSSDRYSAV